MEMGDVVQLVNEFEGMTGKVEVTHQTVEHDDTRPVPLSERFWNSSLYTAPCKYIQNVTVIRE